MVCVVIPGITARYVASRGRYYRFITDVMRSKLRKQKGYSIGRTDSCGIDGIEETLFTDNLVAYTNGNNSLPVMGCHSNTTSVPGSIDMSCLSAGTLKRLLSQLAFAEQSISHPLQGILVVHPGKAGKEDAFFSNLEHMLEKRTGQSVIAVENMNVSRALGYDPSFFRHMEARYWNRGNPDTSGVGICFDLSHFICAASSQIGRTDIRDHFLQARQFIARYSHAIVCTHINYPDINGRVTDAHRPLTQMNPQYKEELEVTVGMLARCEANRYINVELMPMMPGIVDYACNAKEIVASAEYVKGILNAN